MNGESPQPEVKTEPSKPVIPVGQAAIDARKKQQEDAMAKAAAYNAKTEARAKELRAFEGKSFRRKDGTRPSQVHTVTAYGGIANVVVGEVDGKPITAPAHIFKVEARNPGLSWTPVASHFLTDFEQVEVEPAADTQPEVI